jgi:hypothetical protein
MKRSLNHPQQTARGPLSAVVSRGIGPNAPGRASGDTARLSITESQAAKIGILDRWQAAHRRNQLRAQKKTAAATELNRAVQTLLQHAESEQWSQRRMAREVGLSWGGWLRCRDGKANPIKWLPRILSAVNRVSGPRHTLTVQQSTLN